MPKVVEVREPRPAREPQGMGLRNEHVYLRFRLIYWCMQQAGQLFGAMVNQDLAAGERLKQRER